MTFLLVGYLGNLVCALCFLSAARGMTLYPDVESHTWPMGSVIKLNCSHDHPVDWIFPSAEFLVSKEKVPPENVKSDGGYLEITNPTYINVGLYTCRSTQEPYTEKSIYVYVRDLEHLLVADDYNHVTFPPSDYVVLPCKPSFPEVEVTLPDIEEELTKAYDDRKGFTIGPVETDQITCIGQYNGLAHEATFSIIEEHPAEDLPHPEITLSLTGTEQQRVITGRDVTLNCSVETVTGVMFHLEFLNIQNNTRFELIPYGIATFQHRSKNTIGGSTKLIIRGVKKEDEGNYTCSISNASGGKTATYPLKVYDATPFIKLQRNGSGTVLVKPGQDKLTLTASLDAYPQPNIAWWFTQPRHEGPNTIKIKPSRRIIISENMHSVSLTIMKPQANETGIYLVMATPQQGPRSPNEKHSVNFDVTVEGEPVVQLLDTEDSFRRPFLRNTIHSVVCTVYATPKADVVFKFVPCLESEECKKDPPKTLHGAKCTNTGPLTNCTIRSNFTQPGNLSCSARNNLTGNEDIVKSVYINMTEVVGDFAVENLNGNDTKISDLNKIALKCGASKAVYSKMPQWRLEDKVITENKRTTIKKNETYLTFWSTLVIEPPLQIGDHHYHCVVVDHEGIRSSTTTEIQVKASQNATIKNAANGQQGIEIIPGTTLAALRCDAEGFPKPSMSWYKVSDKGKERIDEGQPEPDHLYKFSKEKHQLQFINSTEKIEGQYICEASNIKNTAALQFAVTLRRPQNRIALWIGIFVSLGVIVACIVVIFYLKRKYNKAKKKITQTEGPTFPQPGYVGIAGIYLPAEWSEVLPLNPRWEFPLEKLKLGEILGQGAYGVVMKAEAIGIKADEESTTVAVKRPKNNNKNDDAIKALETELKIMDHIGAHVNVVNLLGACTKYLAQKELLVIVEYCRYGSLDDFLKSHRDRYINQVNPDTGNLESLPGDSSMGFPAGVSRSNSNYNGGGTGYTGMTVQSNATLYTDMTIASSTPVGEDGYLLPSRQISSNGKGDLMQAAQKTVSTTDLLCWGFQIANGMEYLAHRKVVHGDLATRNVLLAEGNIVKLCDFGLAKNLYSYMEDLENSDRPPVRRGNERLPIKWMSIEAIEDRTFSIQSDVWAYGVVLWELFTLGRTPYPDIYNAQEVVDFLRRGQRMPKPEYATQDAYNLMKECWDKAPMLRPSFKECSERLGSMLEESVKQHYMDLNDLYLDLNKDLDENREYIKGLMEPTYENLMAKGRAYVNEEETKIGGPIADQDHRYKNDAEKDAIELKNLLPRPGETNIFNPGYEGLGHMVACTN